jgi:hypothetical protein
MFRRALCALGITAVLLPQSCAPAGGDQPRHPSFDPLRDSLARDEPLPIYNPNPSHPWNRLFHLLFTRTLNVRLAGRLIGPVFMAGDERAAMSDRTVTRIESGDRAIDPLYPSWLWMGSSEFDMGAGGGILRDDRFLALVDALQSVAATAETRPAVDRALMQADLWAAYDLLHESGRGLFRASSANAEERRQRTAHAMRLLARAIRALALTRSEIEALPDTYAAARRTQDLPDLFNPQSGWIEIRWFAHRMHERAMHDRRATRVFVTPASPPPDEAAFLNRFREGHGEALSALDAVALVIQNLLVASDGTVVPSPITYDVQLRRLRSTPESNEPEVLQYELSRQLLLASPESGGLRPVDEDAPAYLPVAGNDLSFATASFQGPRGQPVLVPLRQRCAACHGPQLDHLITFSMISGAEPPPVVRLDPSRDTQAWDVAARKMTHESWKALKRDWQAER